MKRIKLTESEKKIEEDLLEGKYRDVTSEKMSDIAQGFAARRKNAVLHMRINQTVLNQLKAKAEKLGIKYQTFIAEILREVAKS